MARHYKMPRGGYWPPTPAQMQHRSDWHREIARVEKLDKQYYERLNAPPPVRKISVTELMEANKDVVAPSKSSGFGKSLLETIAAAIILKLVNLAWNKFFEKPKPTLPQLQLSPAILAHIRKNVNR